MTPQFDRRATDQLILAAVIVILVGLIAGVRWLFGLSPL